MDNINICEKNTQQIIKMLRIDFNKFLTEKNMN